MSTEKVVCFPEIGDYYVPINLMIERCLHYKTIICPPTTKRTVEIGAKYSPDMICTPYKILLGNLIEALDAGANVLLMPGAGCRLGIYDILQEKVLQELGYTFEMLPLFDYIPSVERLYKIFNERNPELIQEEFANIWAIVVAIVTDMDRLADFMRKNMAFETEKGTFDQLYQSYLKEVQSATTPAEAVSLGSTCMQEMQNVEINKPERPIRIGVIGEMYAVMEPYANCYVETWLVEHGIEVDRSIDLSRIAPALFTVPEQIERSGGYVTYNIGSTANDSLMRAYEMVQNGVDGIIHVKPASCSPEITLMSILQNLSQDTGTPILYLTFDVETGEAGLHTRLEAFHDMIMMKGRKEYEKSISRN